ncbi:O-Antigen ligase [Stieleria varia]|uniref:O-Antigen ligase n=2 Tax=Stieleria varia TaxID=2528005 RepID=A0A5C6A572_9BACT|nr:O-Antigen ligase [Stieleria varia]
MHRVALFPFATLVIFALVAVFNAIQPADGERVSGLTPVLASKLLVAGAATALGGWGLLQSVRVRRCLVSVPGALLSTLAILLVGTAMLANGDWAMISRASALIFCGYLVFTVTALVLVSAQDTARAMVVGGGVFLAITWALFLFVPSIGVFHEYTNDGTSTVPRMGGTNHPNGVAREAMVTVILCIALLRAGRLRESIPMLRWSWGSLLLLAVATLAATYSRTSILAGGVAIGAMLFDKLWGRYGAILVSGFAIMGLTGILVAGIMAPGDAGDSALSAVTKSGDVEELTSLTGRTTIWSEAIDWILQKPLTGYGMDSASSVMTKEAVGTHNLLLHVTFSGGVIAGLILITLLAMTAYHAAASQEPLVRGICTYVLVSGLVEDTLFESFPATLTLLWIMALIGPLVRSWNEASIAQQPSPDAADANILLHVTHSK